MCSNCNEPNTVLHVQIKSATCVNNRFTQHFSQYFCRKFHFFCGQNISSPIYSLLLHGHFTLVLSNLTPRLSRRAIDCRLHNQAWDTGGEPGRLQPLVRHHIDLFLIDLAISTNRSRSLSGIELVIISNFSISSFLRSVFTDISRETTLATGAGCSLFGVASFCSVGDNILKWPPNVALIPAGVNLQIPWGADMSSVVLHSVWNLTGGLPG